MENLRYEMGARIAEARKRKGFTQEVLAEKMDMSVKHISAVERGKSSFSLENLKKLCDILDVSLDYIVTGKNCDILKTPLPKSAIEIFMSDNPSEIDLFLEYIRLYEKIRNSKSGDNNQGNTD